MKKERHNLLISNWKIKNIFFRNIQIGGKIIKKSKNIIPKTRVTVMERWNCDW